MTTVVYADGACRGNPGVGGWGVYAPTGPSGEAIELFGGSAHTTNNIMELTAAIEALQTIHGPLEIRTDSKYVLQGATEWLRGWKAKGWRTASSSPVKNQELWERIDTLLAGRSVQWTWVKGHNGDPGNEKADELANRGTDTMSVLGAPKVTKPKTSAAWSPFTQKPSKTGYYNLLIPNNPPMVGRWDGSRWTLGLGGKFVDLLEMLGPVDRGVQYTTAPIPDAPIAPAPAISGPGLG